MPTIREVKTELRHREWAEQIQECQSSGMTDSVVQGKGDQPAHILLTPECGEKRTAETSGIAFAADRTAECFSKRHLNYLLCESWFCLLWLSTFRRTA